MRSRRVLFGSALLIACVIAVLVITDPNATVGQTKKKIGTDYTEETAPAAGDYFHMVKSGGGAGTDRKVQFSNVPKALLASIANGHLVYNNNGVFGAPTITPPLTATNGAVGMAGLTTLGTATHMPRVNSGATAWEYRSPSQVLSDIGALSSTVPGSATEILFRGSASTLGATTATWDAGNNILNVSGTLVTGSLANSSTSLYLKNSTSGTGLLRFDDGSSSGQVTYDHSTDTMTLATGGASRVTVASGGLTSSVNAILSNSGTATELRFNEPSGSGSNYTAFKAQAQSANVTYTLPAADGTNGYQLTTNGSGTLSWAAAGSGGGLTKFTEAESTSSPNATVYVDSLTAASASTNADTAIVPKGTGALLAAIPDSGTTGGNKRGTNAVDWQTKRTGASQVASGNGSTISGGQYNSATGSLTTVGGGNSNAATSNYAAVGGGSGNTASGYFSAVGGGSVNVASGDYAAIRGGSNNTASGSYSVAGGNSAIASLYGEHTQAGGYFSTYGDAQTSILVARNTTTNGLGGTSLKLDGSSERLTIPASTAWQAQISIVARHAATGDCASWTYTCLITRDGSNNTAIPGNISNSPVQTDYSGVGNAWTVAITADDTNEALQIGVTGETAKTIKWVARVELTEVSG